MKRLKLLLLAGFFIFSAHALAAERTLNVTVVTSDLFRQQTGWQEEIQNRIAFANQLFQNFGITLSIQTYEQWNPPQELAGMQIWIDDLRPRFKPGKDSIVAVFHKMERTYMHEAGEDIDKVGSTLPFEGYLILKDIHQDLEPRLRNTVFVHELAHLFGAVHVADPAAIMSPYLPFEPAPALDADNSAIIQLTHGMDFSKAIDSFSPETLKALATQYEKLIHQNPRGDFYFQLGRFYEKQGLTDKAVTVWENALRDHYDDPLIHRQLGFYYYQQKRYDKAIRELGNAVAQFKLASQAKDRAGVYNMLGVAYFETGQPDQAVLIWLKGLNFDPQNKELLGNLAVGYLQKGDLERARQGLEKILAQSPDDSAALTNLGSVAMKEKKFEEAARLFSAALQNQNPPAADLYLNLGAAYLELKKPASAVAQLEKAKSLQPENADIRQNLVQAYLLNHQPDKAALECEALLATKKNEPLIYSYLGQAYFELGKNKEALEMTTQGVALASGELKADFYRNRAMIYARDGKFQEALNDLKRSAEINWKNAQTHYTLGQIYLQLGEPADARRSFKSALDVDPNLSEAREALQRLD